MLLESRPPAARKSKLPSNPQRQQARNPAAFAANIIPQSIAAPKSAFTSNVNNGNQAKSSLPAPPISTPQPPAPAVPSKLPLYKAIYPFQSQQGGEVSFQKDDTMEIVEKDENGWWLARINGNEGWVPSNYLEECVAPKPPPAPPARKRAQPPIPQQPQQQQQNAQQPTPQRQPEPAITVNRTSQYGDAVSVMPGVGAPTTNGIPAWRAALNAKNASAHKAANDTTTAPTPASRGPPVPAKPSVPGSRPAPSIPSSAGKPVPSIPARPQAAPSPQAPPRNGSPAALSLADAVSVNVRAYFIR